MCSTAEFTAAAKENCFMTDKELRKLGRMELVDIIYQLEKKQNEIEEENKQLQEKLDSVRITIEESGSIAEAAIGINNVFEAAQKAADQYLAEIHLANSEVENRCKLMLSEAENNAALIIERAKAKADAIKQQSAKELEDARAQSEQLKAETDKEIEAKWNDFIERTEQVIKAHAELQLSMERLNSRG